MVTWCKHHGRSRWVRLGMPTPPGEAYLNDSRYDTQGEEDQSPVGKTSEAYPQRDFVLGLLSADRLDLSSL